MIRLQDIRLSFADKTLFSGLSWLIPDGGRVGLVGDNGTGKTTLLRLIRGEVQPDGGAVEIPKKSTWGYLPQDLGELPPLPVGAYLRRQTGIHELEERLRSLEQEIASGAEAPALLRQYEEARERFLLRGGFAFEANARRVLKGLGFAAEDFEKECRDFSGGWKMRILLAAILLEMPEVMLLDEPTNHLDTESMEWLESFLRDYRGTLVAVSHDHMFLDKMTRQTAEVVGGRLQVYRGNYSHFLRQKEARFERLRRERELQKAEIKRVQVFIERFRYKASKAAQVQSRIKLLDKFAELPEEQRRRRVRMRFPEPPRSEKEVVAACGLTKEYGGRRVLEGIDFCIRRGEKVALVGKNGAGKSTLSRLLAGIEAPSAGEIRRGEHVLLAYFSQESAGNLDYRRSVLEEARAAGGDADDQDRRNLLGAFLFSGEAVEKPVGVLSGGEKSRLALLKLLLQKSNCLILDEPTNHLDIQTKEIFQQALLEYSGTVVIVSHDRHFLDELVSRVFEIRDGRVHETDGNYSDFIRRRGEGEEEAASGSEAGPKETPAQKQKERRRREAEERNRRNARRREIQGQIDRCEEAIGSLEEAKSRLEAQLADPEFLGDSARIAPAMIELNSCRRELESRLREWEEWMTALEHGAGEGDG